MSTKDIVYIALFAALTAALGLFPPLSLPAIGVPITAQTMGVMLAGALAGAKRGGLALLLFAVLVAIGLPLLAGGRGGFGIFLGPSGGFVLAWPLGAFVIGWLFERHRGAVTLPLSMLYIAAGGVGVVYLIGIPWLSFAAGLSLPQAFAGSIGFVPGDLIKVVLAALIARGVRRAYPDLASRR
ncbi:biotin transporter BioY [Thalassococcus sp. BH17M4-6]|uniref:biotin transporter BioY n=1 Tax=Thalassococcus sp. BH17M4-6 TaxID=3413148 RepID=UPI003BD6E365